jgi:hypothetical protein
LHGTQCNAEFSCGSNPSTTVITASYKIFGKTKNGRFFHKPHHTNTTDLKTHRFIVGLQIFFSCFPIQESFHSINNPADTPRRPAAKPAPQFDKQRQLLLRAASEKKRASMGSLGPTVSVSMAKANSVDGQHQQPERKEDGGCGFGMPLYYPRYKRADYEEMPKWRVDCLHAPGVRPPRRRRPQQQAALRHGRLPLARPVLRSSTYS